MWNLVILSARAVGVIVGFFCLLTAVLLYPSEEAKVQNVLEDLWVRIDDYRMLAVSRHAAFMQQVASLETTILDWTFGHRLLSTQAIAVSMCCSLASIYLTHLLAGHFLWQNHFECRKWALAFCLSFGVGTLYPLLSGVPLLRLVLVGVVLGASFRNLFYISGPFFAYAWFHLPVVASSRLI